MLRDNFAAMWAINDFMFLFQIGHLDFSQIRRSKKKRVVRVKSPTLARVQFPSPAFLVNPQLFWFLENFATLTMFNSDEGKAILN